jgi:hypothetical protein
MLIGMILTVHEEILRNPQRMSEAPLKFSELLKQLPAGVTVKFRYLFGGGDNFKAIVVFEVQSYEQLMPIVLAMPEYCRLEVHPVIDNSGEVLQQAVR